MLLVVTFTLAVLVQSSALASVAPGVQLRVTVLGAEILMIESTSRAVSVSELASVAYTPPEMKRPANIANIETGIILVALFIWLLYHTYVYHKKSYILTKR